MAASQEGLSSVSKYINGIGINVRCHASAGISPSDAVTFEDVGTSDVNRNCNDVFTWASCLLKCPVFQFCRCPAFRAPVMKQMCLFFHLLIKLQI
jgi:hypothetical protein